MIDKPKLLKKDDSLIIKQVKRINHWFWGTIYRIKYKLNNNVKVSEIVFIEYKTVIALTIIFFINLFLFYKGKLYINIPSLSTEIYVVENTLRTISIFIGIVFSFIVLSFNIFYKYFGRFAFNHFFTSKYIKFLFTLFIGVIVILTYTSGFLKEGNHRTEYGDSLFVISLIISLILVLSIIPTLILLLRSSQNRDNIKLLISQFNKDRPSPYYVHRLLNENEDLHIQRDPITLLIEIGTAAIKDYDRISLLTISNGCKEHLMKLLDNYKNIKIATPYDFYEKMFDLTRNIFHVAIKERNETAALIIINLQFNLEEIYLNYFPNFYNLTNEHQYDGIAFSVTFEQFFNRAIQFNEDAVCERIIDIYRDWICKIINTHLPYLKYDHNINQRFSTDPTSFFIHTLFRNIDQLFSLLINYKKLYLYESIANLHRTVDLTTIGSSNTRGTKIYLLHQNNISSLATFEKFVKLTDREITSAEYAFQLSVTQDLTDVKSFIPYNSELKAFEILFAQKKLNFTIINLVKTTAFFLLKHFVEDTSFKKLLLNLIEKFDLLRSYIKEDDTDFHKDIYLTLERYLGYIQIWVPEFKVDDSDIITSLSNTLANFNYKDRFKEELDAKGFIFDDPIA